MLEALGTLYRGPGVRGEALFRSAHGGVPELRFLHNLKS